MCAEPQKCIEHICKHLCDFDANGLFTLPDIELDTDADKKNGLFGIVWRWSHCIETDITTDSYLFSTNFISLDVPTARVSMGQKYSVGHDTNLDLSDVWQPYL